MLAFRVQLLAPGELGPVQAAAAGQLPFGLSGQVEVEFVAGEQEQEAEADVGQQVDGGPIGPAERLGADQHATDQQDHHLGMRGPGSRATSSGASAATTPATSSISSPLARSTIQHPFRISPSRYCPAARPPTR